MPLAGKTILITRPKDQSSGLEELVKQASGQALIFPLLAIHPCSPEKLASALQNIQSYDKVIFISRNAANIALQYLQSHNLRLESEQCIPMGEATLGVLNAYGYQPKQAGLSLATTETLLQQEVFSAAKIAKQRVLIIRGNGGRQTLGDKLQSRNAVVTYAEVYIREKVTYSLEEKHEIISAKLDVSVLTSNEGIDAYHECFYDIEPNLIESLAVVVLSQRNKDYARSIGFKGAIQVVTQTSDQGLLDACMQLCN